MQLHADPSEVDEFISRAKQVLEQLKIKTPERCSYAMKVPSTVLKICQTLRDGGHEAWLVGGAVRDTIMGRKAHDWDIATDAHPKTVIELFPHVIATGIQHGTVTVIEDGEGFEITTFRGEEGYSDGRHPDRVRFLNTIEEDLARRDFTINAIAYEPIVGVFSDPYDGRGDIERRTIKAVGTPSHRFAEDGLRVLRAVRFAATLGFEIESETLASIRPSLNTFRQVAIERIQAEWVKIMSAPVPSRAFRLMASTGLLEATVPEMIPMIGCPQNRYHEFDVWDHTLAVLDAVPPNLALRLAALFHDVAKPLVRGMHPVSGDGIFYNHEVVGADMTRDILNRMRFSNEVRDQVVHLVRHHFIRYELGGSASSIRRWVRRVGLENVTDLCILARADIAGKGNAYAELEPKVIDELENRIADMRITETIPTSTSVLAINGRDVMERLGIDPGPRVGQILLALLEAVTEEPELNTRDWLLEFVSSMEK